LDIEALKKEQNYDSKNLYVFMKNWDYSIWEDFDVREAIKMID